MDRSLSWTTHSKRLDDIDHKLDKVNYNGRILWNLIGTHPFFIQQVQTNLYNIQASTIQPFLFTSNNKYIKTSEIYHFFFMTLDPPLWCKSPIHDPTRHNLVLSNLRKLLVGIEPNMFGSTVHLQPPTTRLHPDGSKELWHIRKLCT